MVLTVGQWSPGDCSTERLVRGSMFAGLVEEQGVVRAVEPCGPGTRLKIVGSVVSQGTKLGDSIAVNGCCLTVVGLQGACLDFDAGPETLQRTNLGALRDGDRVNLERSLVVGDRLGGHFVTGHVDTVGALRERIDQQPWSTFWFELDRRWSRHLASKGSVAVDGISLTLVDVTDEAFSVALIPHTMGVTTLGTRRVGDRVNIETDLLAKYVERQLASEP